MPIPQSQLVMPPIMVSRRTNRHLELGGTSHDYSAKKLRNMGVPNKDRITVRWVNKCTDLHK